MIDEQGKTLWQTDYSPWGEHLSSPETTSSINRQTDQPIRFQGQFEDEESGLYYNRYRYYDPRAGRYLSKDPIGLAGGVNLVGYIDGCPTSYIDPRGLALTIAPNLQQVVDRMRQSSSIFRNLTDTLEKSDYSYNIKTGKLPEGRPALTVCGIGGGCSTVIDPDQLSKLQYPTTTGGKACVGLDRTIGHELSHSLYYEQLPAPFNWLSPHSYIINNENRIMNQIDPSSPNRTPNNDTLYKKK